MAQTDPPSALSKEEFNYRIKKLKLEGKPLTLTNEH